MAAKSKCVVCGKAVTLRQGYIFNLKDGEVWHKRCPRQAQGQ